MAPAQSWPGPAAAPCPAVPCRNLRPTSLPHCLLCISLQGKISFKGEKTWESAENPHVFKNREKRKPGSLQIIMYRLHLIYTSVKLKLLYSTRKNFDFFAQRWLATHLVRSGLQKNKSATQLFALTCDSKGAILQSGGAHQSYTANCRSSAL